MEACYPSQQFNVTSYGAITVAFVTLEAFPGMWINAFLVCVRCIAWVKKKTLNSNEKILLLLGCSRFCYLCFSWVYCSLSITYPNYLYVQPTFQLIVCFQAFYNCSSLWVSASLCVFYCIKIANFRNSFFIYLKVKTDRIVPCLLLTSLLSALAIGIIAYDITVTQLSINCNSTRQGNFPKVRGKEDVKFFPDIFYLWLWNYHIFHSSPFSLWRHKCKMQKNSMNSLSMDAHIKAMKSILSFFIMYCINFIFLILSLNNSTKKENYVAFLSLLFLYAFPGIHSLILIFINPKLEKTLIRILFCVKCKDCMR